MTDEGIEFPVGGAVAGIQVELTNQASDVSGTVRDARGGVVKDYTALVYAQEPGRRTGPTRYYALARPDETGKFSVKGLPAGNYYAIALDYADAELAADPEYLEPLTRSATAFTLSDLEQKTLNLQLVQ